MAKPVTLVPKQHNAHEDLPAKLQAAELEHADAILSAYDLLQTLDDQGVLDILRGLASTSGDIAERASGALNTPEAIRAMRNLIAASKVIAGIDPDLLHRLSSSVADAMEKNENADATPPSLWAIFRKARSENSRRALSAAVDALELLGQGLKSEKGKR